MFDNMAFFEEQTALAKLETEDEPE